jgi:hypothetical protein
VIELSSTPDPPEIPDAAAQLLQHVRDLHKAFTEINRILDTVSVGLKQALELGDRLTRLEQRMRSVEIGIGSPRRIGPPDESFVSVPPVDPAQLEQLRTLMADAPFAQITRTEPLLPGQTYSAP